MMWHIQVDPAGIVTSYGVNVPSPREGVTDYEVASIPDHKSGDVLTYDDGVITVDSTERIAGEKARIEPEMLAAHARWQSAVTLDLECEPQCRAKYESLRAEYDALGGT